MGALSNIKKVLLVVVLGFMLFLQGCRNNNSSKPKLTTAKEVQSNKSIAAEGLLEVGFAMSLARVDEDSLLYAKSVGVDHIEISGLGMFVSANREFKYTDSEITQKLKEIKNMVDKAGINIWSIHMPFGSQIDLSILDENQRKEVVNMHKKLLKHLKVLEPEIVLFHPSYYLELQQRNLREKQLIKSAETLDAAVQEIGAVMVIENMLGPKLLVDENRERPLMRTVEESVAIFSKLPKTIGLAVDTNHILNAEELIIALGDRLKTLHIADGTGQAENHWFPCDYKGKNNWDKVLAALDQVNYNGPFMYESPAKDVQEYMQCYQELYKHYIGQ